MRNAKTKNRFLILIITMILGVIMGILWHWSMLFPFPQIYAWRTSQISANHNRQVADKKKRMIERLRSLAYLAGSQLVTEKKNVTKYRKDRTYNGLNLIVSGHAPEAVLIDMDGNELHKWSCDAFRAWENFKPIKPTLKKNPAPHKYWRQVHLMENGDLFAIYGGGIGLIKLDKDSNLIWSNRNGAHHELSVASNGYIYVLTRKSHINKKYSEVPILEDFVCVLDQDGRELKRVSILDAIENSPFRPFINKKIVKGGDVTHTNAI